MNVIANQQLRPYRVIAFATGTRIIGKGKRQRIKQVGYGYIAWNASEQDRKTYDPGRLVGAGTFCWPGVHGAYRAAMRELARPEVHQVSVRTNQDRSVYRYYKQIDGRITGYGDRD